RVWRTRASASSVRNTASATAGASLEATRTASPNDRRSAPPAGGGRAARTNGRATSDPSRPINPRLVFRDAMEIQVDVRVKIVLHVETLWHAGREGEPRNGGVHQRRHRELGGDHHVHGTELAGGNAPLDHARHEAVAAGHDLVVVEAR